MRKRFSVTYEIFTEESIEQGDAEERGFVVQDTTLRDAIDNLFQCDIISWGEVSIEGSTYPIGGSRWFAVDHGQCIETGNSESRSLHLPEGLTPSTIKRIGRLLGA